MKAEDATKCVMRAALSVHSAVRNLVWGNFQDVSSRRKAPHIGLGGRQLL